MLLTNAIKSPRLNTMLTVLIECEKLVLRKIVKIDEEKCNGCGVCIPDCVEGAIKIIKTGDKKFAAEITLDKCIYCGQCADSCLKKAVEITPNFELAQLTRENLKVLYDAEPEKKS